MTKSYGHFKKLKKNYWTKKKTENIITNALIKEHNKML